MQGSLILIKQKYSSLSQSEKKVATYILNNPQEVLKLKISDLANKANSSCSTVTRLCKKIGATSFRELKIDLTRDIYSHNKNKALEPNTFDFSRLKNTDGIVRSMTTLICENISIIPDVLNTNEIDKVITAIQTCNNLLLVGIGASGLVAQDFAQKLLRLGITSHFYYDTDLALVHATNLKKGDICFTISYSGETKAVKKITEVAKHNNATIISLTKIGDNTISKLSDISLTIPDVEPVYREGAFISRLNQFTVIDILYTTLLSKLSNSNELLFKTWKEVHK
jgi:DNA-binding MurR/RpiR family transcriptional regulator